MTDVNPAKRRRIGTGAAPRPSVYPVTVRGKMPSSRSGVTTFARLEFTDEHVYVAMSPNKGVKLASVDRLPLDGLRRTDSGGKKGKLLDSEGRTVLTWSGCGCSNSWGTKTRDAIIAKGDASAS